MTIDAEEVVQSRLIGGEGGLKTFALVFETGDEAVEGLDAFAHEQRLSGAQLTGIGAFSDVVVGYFDWTKKEYKQIPFLEQVEVLVLVGDIALSNGHPSVHAHVVIGLSDGSAKGGHLICAHVRPTLEVIVSESPAHLCKRYDETTGLPLIALES